MFLESLGKIVFLNDNDYSYMVSKEIENILIKLSQEYNDPKYFSTDPIIIPKHFAEKLKSGQSTLQDVEISGILAAHLAWGRREMIVRDCNRMMDEMEWQPYNYVLKGKFRNDNVSLHRTIKWSEFASICRNLKLFYSNNSSLEMEDPRSIRRVIFGQKDNPKAANKKIHMFRRWMVRSDGIVDLGVWKAVKPSDLVIPLDVHVHRTALNLGITCRKSADIITAMEITTFLKELFPEDPCKGDFALFAYAATRNQKND